MALNLLKQIYDRAHPPHLKNTFHDMGATTEKERALVNAWKATLSRETASRSWSKDFRSTLDVWIWTYTFTVGVCKALFPFGIHK